eukprot:403335153
MISYPLDTVKVRIQLSKKSENVKVVSVVYDIYMREGLRGFFKGVLSPILGRAPISAVLFTAQGFSKRYLEPTNLNIHLKHYLSGFFAGLCYTNVAFIFDLLKTRAQVSKYKTMSYREEISKIYEYEGLKGFTRGYTGMFFRDAPGFGLYFCLFEALKRFSHVPQLVADEHHNKFDVGLRKFICGGTAGVITWFAVYPMDTVKVKMQTYEGPDFLKFRKVFFETLMRQHGFTRLYRGIHIQILRAFPTSASSLLVFESCRDYMLKHNLRE